ncbi:MAG: HD domain-containing protein [Hoeflea sp.]|uniref:HD-GYP domain-containing protein n=1 Tax=Hoeflea sp. TaxID=1940281 RepID=UPI001DDE0219|nr:HD domain-containing protein [Hoeflea sp.]MBU4531477.1 HD domain-containing protein [Alphaproteobacteria bacterium]MBU4544334.1 HD domain-containing protein [Alphaproteobacteria bacterium]MBU4550429.1 HD domain-containing protein [Alphaproteobacteria bacterium]MBV1724753.1 HD domain-containing protein [Hoeflea sp.]MBV1760773.1 HD domain-containing protein [Hoeflea sp.]
MSSSLYLTLAKPARPAAFKLADLLGALSYALDMTEGQPEGHCIRCAWIGTRIGEALELPDEVLKDLYYTLLLKDLGCSSNAARICELYLADDIAFKRDFKTIDGSLSSALRFVFRKTGLESGLSERIRAIVNILQNGGEISRNLIETRCHRGADIAAQMRFSEAVRDGIRSLDEHWDGSGKPEGLTGDRIPLIARLALMAQVIDVFHTENGASAALSEIKARSGAWFDPALVAAFVTAQADPEFWAMLTSPELEARVFSMKPALQSEPVNEDYLDDIAAAFSDVVDAKSPFTADHSNRVTLYTDMIAEEMGLSPDHRRWLRRAALLHDLGKLGVSNQVLDKPGKPDADEWTSIRRHPAQSEAILRRVHAFHDIAPIAAAHHERLDGKGYPYGLKGDEICLEARILTVADVFDALSAERPYRAAMPISRALAILDTDAGTAFDPACIAALKSGLARLNAEVAA